MIRSHGETLGFPLFIFGRNKPLTTRLADETLQDNVVMANHLFKATNIELLSYGGLVMSVVITMCMKIHY